MKIKRLLLSIVVLVVAVSLWSCKKDPKPEPFTPTPIETVLQEASNNDDIQVEGVVYGVIKNGFYVADSELGRVFVVMGSSWTPNVEVGDKVQLSAQFSYVANFPQIKNVKELKVASKNNSLLITKTTTTVTELKAKDKTLRTGVYGELVELVATVGKNTANMYTLTDDDGNAILFTINRMFRYCKVSLTNALLCRSFFITTVFRKMNGKYRLPEMPKRLLKHRLLLRMSSKEPWKTSKQEFREKSMVLWIFLPDI